MNRQEFVQAGSLEIGERLQTLSGDVKVVQQKLPRPGPQPVFNLEVHNEHVYFVGQDGVLVHNSKVHDNLARGSNDDFRTLMKTAAGYTPHHLVYVTAATTRGLVTIFRKAVTDGCNGLNLSRTVEHAIGNSHPKYRAHVEDRIKRYFSANGGLSRFSSGHDADRRFPQPAAIHVERKAAMWMRDNGCFDAVLLHNHPSGTCNMCDKTILRFLPTGAELEVMPQRGTVAQRNWFVRRNPCIGNDAEPALRDIQR